jgi:hypothetical protein
MRRVRPALPFAHRALGLVLVTAASLSTHGCTGSDGGAGGGGGAAQGVDPFCATRPKLTFCEDFDESELPGRFDGQYAEGCELSSSAAQSSSPPRALLVSCAGTTQSPARGGVYAEVDSAGKLRWFGQVHVESLPSVGQSDLGAFELSGVGYRAAFGVDADGRYYVRETRGGESTTTTGELAVRVGVWSSVRWDVDLETEGPSTGWLRIGNDTAVSIGELAPPAGHVGARVTVHFGVDGVRSDGLRVHYDNLTIEADDP